jgi:hypothetical protein
VYIRCARNIRNNTFCAIYQVVAHGVAWEQEKMSYMWFRLHFMHAKRPIHQMCPAVVLQASLHSKCWDRNIKYSAVFGIVSLAVARFQAGKFSNTATDHSSLSHS